MTIISREYFLEDLKFVQVRFLHALSPIWYLVEIPVVFRARTEG